MKIAIHNSKSGFHQRWINYCKENSINYKIVDCYATDIIEQMSDCYALMWHHSHMNSKDIVFAQKLLFALEHAGKVVFPDFKSAWHFDDKVAQKYLLEAISAPLVPTWVFYSKAEANAWAQRTQFPKVFKLRSGAGSSNVKLIRDKTEAEKHIKKAFGKGFSQYNAWESLKDRWLKFREGKSDFQDVLKGFIRFVYPSTFTRMAGKEIGYVYFQEFIPDNTFDIRVIVIDEKAFAIKRLVRRHDFRASGSGNILYEKENFNESTIKLAFTLADKLQLQCVAFDFVYDQIEPKVVEISYGFMKEGYDKCVGFWDRELVWHQEPFNFCGWMVEKVVKQLQR